MIVSKQYINWDPERNNQKTQINTPLERVMIPKINSTELRL